MKKLVLLIITLANFSTGFAQLQGDWYGLITRSNRVTGNLVVHISKSNDQYSAVVDFPSENKVGLKPEIFRHQASIFYLVLEEYQIAISGTVDSTTATITGEIIYNGRPFPLVLTTNKSYGQDTVFPTRTRQESNDPSLSPDINTVAPIAHRRSLFIEELSWIEVRDAMRAGKTTVIIATGGIEQSGPYIPTGKHNFILRLVTQAVAEKLGDALVAPIIPFVPEGNHQPPTSHMKYPGSISLQEKTYELLLHDIATSYLVQGFKTIIFIGDSGGNQWGMYKVAVELTEHWQKEKRNVLYVHEYYDNNRLSAWLKEQGINEGNEGLHDNVKVTTQIMVLDPNLVHTHERIAAGKFSINGIALAPVEKSIALGKKIIEYQTSVTVEAIKKRLKPD